MPNENQPNKNNRTPQKGKNNPKPNTHQTPHQASPARYRGKMKCQGAPHEVTNPKESSERRRHSRWLHQDDRPRSWEDEPHKESRAAARGWRETYAKKTALCGSAADPDAEAGQWRDVVVQFHNILAFLISSMKNLKIVSLSGIKKMTCRIGKQRSCDARQSRVPAAEPGHVDWRDRVEQEKKNPELWVSELPAFVRHVACVRKRRELTGRAACRDASRGTKGSEKPWKSSTLRSQQPRLR